MKKRNNNSFDRAKSAAFTGHRYYDFSRKEIIRQRLSREGVSKLKQCGLKAQIV